MATTRFIDIKVRSSKAGRNVDKLNRKMKGLGRSTDKTTRSMSSLSKVAAAVGAALSIRAIVSFSDAVQKADNQLRNITDSAEQFNVVQMELNRIANETRQDVNDLTGVYARFARAGTELGLTHKEVLGFTENLTKAFKLEGNTTAEVNSAMIQLTQAFRSGRIAGEEFRALSESSGIALKALATQMGVNVGELKELAAEGLVTPQKLIEGLKKMEPEINRQFASLEPTFAEAGTRLSNAFSEAFRASAIGGFFNDLKNDVIGGVDAIAFSLTDAGKLVTTQYDLMQRIGMDAIVSIRASSEEIVRLQKNIKESVDPAEIIDLQTKIAELKLAIDESTGEASFLDEEFFNVKGLIREYALLVIAAKQARDAAQGKPDELEMVVTGGSEAVPEAQQNDFGDKLTAQTERLRTELALRKAVTDGFISQGKADEIARFTEEQTVASTKFEEELIKLAEDELTREELRAQFREFQLAAVQEFEANLTAVTADETTKRVALEASANARVVRSKEMTQNALLGLIGTFAGKSKAAALVLIALQKGIAISNTITGALAGSVKVFGELPYPAAVVASGQILAQGKITAGLIAATGLAQGASIASGGGSVSTSANIGGGSSFNSGNQPGQNIPPPSQRVVDIRLDDDAILTGAAVKELMSSVLSNDDDITLQIAANQEELTRTGNL